MDKTIEKNIAEFMKAINRDAFIECKKIEVQTNEYKESQINLAKDDLQSSLQRDKNHKLIRMRSETNIKISNLMSDMRKNLIDQRETLMSEVFKDVRKEINDFTKMEQYQDWLIQSAKKVSETVEGDLITVYLSEADMKYKDEIGKIINRNCEFKVDKSIVLGGLIVSSGNVIVDDTFENRLLEQEDWFMLNSGLSII